VNRKTFFWIGPLALLTIVSVGAAPADAAQAKPRAKSKRTATAKTEAPVKTAHRTTAYSAERSLSRKATLARARATATAREMADTVLPRYKVDASGDLVPDVHAAAAIIYNPETNQVLWEENSQDKRSIASIPGHDRDGVPRGQSRPVADTRSRAATSSRPTTHLHANDRMTGDDSAASADCSDNAARALARVSVYARKVHSPMNRAAGRKTSPRIVSPGVAHDMARSAAQTAFSRQACLNNQVWQSVTAVKHEPLPRRPDVDVAGKTGSSERCCSPPSLWSQS
jgi:hypothetical protein